MQSDAEFHARPANEGPEAVRAQFGGQMGPTLIVLHLQRGTAITSPINESWRLVRRLVEEAKGVAVVVRQQAAEHVSKESTEKSSKL